MSRTEFKPEDFKELFLNQYVSERANQLLPEIKEAWKAEMLKDAVVVYGEIENNQVSANFGKNKNPSDTHKALLIQVEPIVKEDCKHEPKKWYKRGETMTVEPVCYFCGVELVAEWKAKA